MTPRRRAWVAVVLALVVGGSLSGYWLHGRLEKSRALAAVESGSFADAEPLLRQALTRSPRDIELLRAIVQGYGEADRVADAEPLLRRWCDLRPQDEEPYRLRFESYRRRARHREALTDGLHLLELAPDDLDIRRKVAASQFALGSFAESEDECRAILGRKPGDRSARSLLAQALRARGDPAGAGAVLDQLLRAEPDFTRAMMSRAILFLESGSPALAIPLLERVIRLDPRRQRTARYQLSLAYERVGRHDDARRVMQEVRRMQEADTLRTAVLSQPDNLALCVRAAEALLENGNTGEGLDMLAGVLARDHEYGPAHLALADHFDRQNQSDRANAHRRRAGGKP